ncbi:MAG: glycerol-3-phosphate dehydrogenase, partial [Betaproteobacteria bacterium]|nr:glycerol-3-phosphate dehydrogenase [Betaproteobacteria bacterium]
MRVAVLGGGNGAHAAIADLTERGHEVRHWRRDAAALRAKINLKDAIGMREVRIAKPCADIGEAVRGAELVFMPDPAFTQADNARRLAPHLADGQVVFLAPGTFGSYVMAKAVRDAGNRSRFAMAETGTLPWLTRKHGPDTTAITARATRLPTGVFPARLNDDAFALLQRLFPAG